MKFGDERDVYLQIWGSVFVSLGVPRFVCAVKKKGRLRFLLKKILIFID